MWLLLGTIALALNMEFRPAMVRILQIHIWTFAFEFYVNHSFRIWHPGLSVAFMFLIAECRHQQEDGGRSTDGTWTHLTVVDAREGWHVMRTAVFFKSQEGPLFLPFIPLIFDHVLQWSNINLKEPNRCLENSRFSPPTKKEKKENLYLPHVWKGAKKKDAPQNKGYLQQTTGERDEGAFWHYKEWSTLSVKSREAQRRVV